MSLVLRSHVGSLLAAAIMWSVLGCQSPGMRSLMGPEDADASPNFTRTESGLKYRVLRKGNGNFPTASSSVNVDYKGWLEDGEEFDSSYKRGKPASFGLGSVVPGWTEGLQLVSEGGMIELEIPPELGYGAAGSPGSIPPNATLHFKVELHQVR